MLASGPAWVTHRRGMFICCNGSKGNCLAASAHLEVVQPSIKYRDRAWIGLIVELRLWHCLAQAPVSECSGLWQDTERVLPGEQLASQIPIDVHPRRPGAEWVLKYPYCGCVHAGPKSTKECPHTGVHRLVKPGLGSWRTTAVWPMWQGLQQNSQLLVLTTGAQGSSGAWGCAGFHCSGSRPASHDWSGS